jgi:hypothetical protein
VRQGWVAGSNPAAARATATFIDPTSLVIPQWRPGDFAKLVLAIADNGYLNGDTIRMDGALRMQPK